MKRLRFRLSSIDEDVVTNAADKHTRAGTPFVARYGATALI